MSTIQRLAIVNRGEAAIRCLTAAAELNASGRHPVRTIAMYTDPDANAWFVRLADEAVDLGPAMLVGPDGRRMSAYVDVDHVMAAVLRCRADVVWVGWGFAAESAEFAARCEAAGITFVGPSSDVMRQLADKVAAKTLAESVGVPTVPWSGGCLADEQAVLVAAERLGYPMVLKAAAGGGGRGIRLVGSPSAVPQAFRSARAEAEHAFGDDRLFAEALVRPARHVEVQVAADAYGGTWALGVRDCSVQRRHQKILEESASTVLDAGSEAHLKDAAVRICKAAGYVGAGTVEFLVAPDTGRVLFMEVNTRLQVEHPVTEVTTGVDMVKLQLHIAAGGRLDGAPPATRGHSVEVRLTAEDPEQRFAPAPGRVGCFRIPTGAGVRVDTGVCEGDVIGPEFDSMIAKIIAWGSDRQEALARLRRTLADAVVVVEGGATNKGFLLHLLDRPEVHAGAYHNAWLDELGDDGGLLPPVSPVALLVAAVESYDVEAAAERRTFFATAARGRPELPDSGGRAVALRLRGRPYRLTVHHSGRDSYVVVTESGPVDVTVRRVAEFERLVTCNDRQWRVVVDRRGDRLLVEVDGAPHVIVRDDGTAVRAAAPAFVVDVLVAAGDSVRQGDSLVVVESMKMETAVRAPYDGIVRSVSVAANNQVEAGALLLRLQSSHAEEPALRDTDDVLLTSLVRPPADDGSLPTFARLRSYLLGYDLDEDSIRQCLRDWAGRGVGAAPDDPSLLAREREVLDIFTDVAGMFAREPVWSTDDDWHASSREQLITFLAARDPDRAGLPESFTERLLAALSWWGVSSLEPDLDRDEALLHLYRSSVRLPRVADAVGDILRRWIRDRDALRHAFDDAAIRVVRRLVGTAPGRFPDLGELAQDVHYRFVNEPVLERTRALVYADVHRALAELASADEPTARDLVERVVACPQPMRARLRDAFRAATDPVARQRLIETRTRRMYRIRPLVDVTCRTVGGDLVGSASYEHDGHDVRLLTAYVPLVRLPMLVDELRPVVAELPADAWVLLDVETWRSGRRLPADDMAAELAALLDGCDVGRPLHRLDVTVTSDSAGEEHRRTQHFSYRQEAPGGYREEKVYRNLHPMIAKRLSLRRLEEFELERLPSVEDVYLFHAVARSNPQDERLVALAEVRDLTVAPGSTGRPPTIPHLERMLAESFAALRHGMLARPPRQRPLHNRVLLYVRPEWHVAPDILRDLAHRLAPLSHGLGLEKVAAQVHFTDPETGEPREATLDVEHVSEHGVTVRMRPIARHPLRPMSVYIQKVVRCERLGVPYPYELLRMFTPPADATSDFPAGAFEEYDLTPDGSRLEVVTRGPGENDAGVVVGVVTNFTRAVPEGMRRVTLVGDPTRSLGSLAEPECRRIIAALDLAHDLRLPVEWFALSSGARISMDSGTENMDWIAAVLRRIIEFTQQGGEINLVVTGINVGAQPYWNAEATMLMHTKGILVMTPRSAMVLTGKSALDYSGGVSAEDNFGIGGYDRVMGPNGQAQYWAPTLADAFMVLLRHYEHTYVVPGERYPRRLPTTDPVDRDIGEAEHRAVSGCEFTRVGDVFSAERNAERKSPFDMRSVMRALADQDSEPLERWPHWRDAEMAIVWDARVGGIPASLIGIESRPLPRRGFIPADGPPTWTAGTLFPQSSRKIARAVNNASGNRPLVVLANLSGFDGAPESMAKWQLEYGAEIGRAVTNFRGPIVFVVVSRYHGGAFVVFSKRLNERLEVTAVEGSYASVIGGAPAAAVVLSREVNARTESDPRVAALREGTTDEPAAPLREQLSRTTAGVRAEKLKEVADEFDAVHDIARAQRVGSVDRIIPAARVRPYVIDALERMMAVEAREEPD